MDYEKKYRDLVEAVKKLQEANPSDEGIQNWVNDNVPELAESEDEKIRKALLEHIKKHLTAIEGIDRADAIAWLERQGKQSKQIEEIKGNDGKISPKWTEEDSLMIDSIIDTMKWLEGKGATDMKIDWLKQLKQRLGYQPMTPIVQKDVDDLVYNFKWSKESFKDKRVTDIYRQGIYDVVELLKQRMQ